MRRGSNVNKNLHYEFMCTNGTSAVHLCDPKDGSIVNFKGDKTPTSAVKTVSLENGSKNKEVKTCADAGTKREYVPIDAYRFGRKNIKDVNFEGKQYYRESKEWGGNAGNNSTKKNHTVSCAAHGGVCDRRQSHGDRDEAGHGRQTQ